MRSIRVARPSPERLDPRSLARGTVGRGLVSARPSLHWPRWTSTWSRRSRRRSSARRSTPSCRPGSVRRGAAGRVAFATWPMDGHIAHGGHEARSHRDLLLPALHGVQSRIGFISQPALAYVCRRLTVPPAEAYGVATFYALFATSPRPPVVAHVCDDIACRLSGAEELCAALERSLGPAGAPALDGGATWLRSPCLGQCERAPAALFTIAGETPRTVAVAPIDAAGVVGPLEAPPGDPIEASSAPSDARLDGLRTSVPQAGAAGLRLLARIGRVDPTSLDDYRANGGYRALARAIELGPERVIDEVTASKLVGRGGAAFPTGRKWAAVATQPARPHYLVCNADESEPGTFKDRALLEEDPFAIVEAMTIAGYRDGRRAGLSLHPRRVPAGRGADRQRDRPGPRGRAAGRGHPRLRVRLRHRAPARRRRLHLRRGDRALRVDRGQARRAPQQAAVPGRGRPVRQADDGQQRRDARQHPGDRARRRGGLRGDRHRGLHRTEAVLPVRRTSSGRASTRSRSGRPCASSSSWPAASPAAGPSRRSCSAAPPVSFVGPDALDTPLTFEGTRAIGATLGSGVVMVFDETADLVGALRRIAAFFRDESCGQCVPCRVGTVRQEEILARLVAGRPNGSAATELALLRDVGQAMRDASICGLGQTASSAIESALRQPDLVSPVSIDPILFSPPARSEPAARGADRSPRLAVVELTIDGVAVSVPAGSTILDACRAQGIDTPTLCYLENLTPVNVCRVCVVEVEGARVLAPACSRPVEPGMEVLTDSERVRHSRKLVIELLGSSVDVDAGRAAGAGRLAGRVRPALRGRSARGSASRLARRRPANATPTRPAITMPPTASRPRRPSPSRSRSTTSCTSATTRAASSATSASRRAASMPRTRSRSPSPGAGSTPGSRPSGTSGCPTPPASTAATASASARPAP